MCLECCEVSLERRKTISQNKVILFSAGYSLFGFDKPAIIKGDLEVFCQSRPNVYFEFSSVFIRYCGASDNLFKIEKSGNNTVLLDLVRLRYICLCLRNCNCRIQCMVFALGILFLSNTAITALLQPVICVGIKNSV